MRFTRASHVRDITARAHPPIHLRNCWTYGTESWCVVSRVVLDSYFSGCLVSDACDNPGDSTLTQTKMWFFFLDNADPTHLSQGWDNYDSRLITFDLIWPKLVDGGGGGRLNVAVGWFLCCNATGKCEISTFSLQKKISDSTLAQAVSRWHNSDSNDNQRNSTLAQLIWVRVESNLTHDLWVEHNPGG